MVGCRDGGRCWGSAPSLAQPWVLRGWVLLQVLPSRCGTQERSCRSSRLCHADSTHPWDGDGLCDFLSRVLAPPHSWLSKTVLTVLRSWRKTRGCARPGGALGRGCGLNAAFASTCPDPARFLLWKTHCLQQNTVQWVRTEGVKCSARCSEARNWFLMQPEICQQLRIAPGDGGVYVAVTRVTACSQQPWPPIPPPGP